MSNLLSTDIQLSDNISIATNALKIDSINSYVNYIKINCNNNDINSIAFHYIDDSSNLFYGTRNNITENFDKIFFLYTPFEFIIRIFGFISNDKITGIQFYTNYGRKSKFIGSYRGKYFEIISSTLSIQKNNNFSRLSTKILSTKDSSSSLATTKNNSIQEKINRSSINRNKNKNNNKNNNNNNNNNTSSSSRSSSTFSNNDKTNSSFVDNDDYDDDHLDNNVILDNKFIKASGIKKIYRRKYNYFYAIVNLNISFNNNNTKKRIDNILPINSIYIIKKPIKLRKILLHSETRKLVFNKFEMPLNNDNDDFIKKQKKLNAFNLAITNKLHINSMKGGSKSIARQIIKTHRNKNNKYEKHVILRYIINMEEFIYKKDILSNFEKEDIPVSVLRQLLAKGPNSTNPLPINHMLQMKPLYKINGKQPKSLLYDLFQGGKNSIIRQIFDGGLNSLAHLIVAPDLKRGLPSILQLILEGEGTYDENNENEDVQLSLIRKLLYGEQFGEISTMRLLQMNDPPIIKLLIDGENKNPKSSLLRKTFEEKPHINNGLSASRVLLSETPRGKPPVARFMFDGKGGDINKSMLKLVLNGENRKGQTSLLRLLMIGSHRKDKPNRKSILELFTMGQPTSLLDLLIKGEGTDLENSIMRSSLGTNISIKNGRIQFSGILDSKNGISLAQLLLGGEELGGPGISFMRMLLFGEQNGETSLIRLLMIGEFSTKKKKSNNNDNHGTSPIRLMLTGAYAAIATANKQKNNKTENDTAMKNLYSNLKNAITSIGDASDVENQSWAVTIKKVTTDIKDVVLESANQAIDQFGFVYAGLLSISKRANNDQIFKETWKKQWLLIANEVHLAYERSGDKTAFKAIGPRIEKICIEMSKLNWIKALGNVAALLTSLEKENRDYWKKFVRSKLVKTFSTAT